MKYMRLTDVLELLELDQSVIINYNDNMISGRCESILTLIDINILELEVENIGVHGETLVIYIDRVEGI